MRGLATLGARIVGHTLAILAGFAMMVLGLALGVTMVLLPIGLAVGVAGVLLFVWGVLEWQRRPS